MLMTTATDPAHAIITFELGWMGLTPSDSDLISLVFPGSVQPQDCSDCSIDLCSR
jgi:hypothetical protein